MKRTRQKQVNFRCYDEDINALRAGVAAFRQLQTDPATATIKNASDFLRLAIARLTADAINALAKEAAR